MTQTNKKHSVKYRFHDTARTSHAGYCISLVFRTKIKTSERLQVKCTKDAFDIFMENWDLDSENI